MTEVRVGVVTYAVRKRCDACGQGEMLPTMPSHYMVPQFQPHACTVCGAKANYPTRYPEVRRELGSLDQPFPAMPEMPDVRATAREARPHGAKPTEVYKRVGGEGNT